MISKSNVKCTDSNVKFADSEVRMASRFASSTQQEIEKLLEDKDLKTVLFNDTFFGNAFNFSALDCFIKTVNRCDNAFVVIFFKTMYNKTIIRFGFCDIRNNQGLG